MPTDADQPIPVIFEISLFLIGLWLLYQLGFNRAFRARWLHTNHLPTWSIAPAEFAMYLLLLFTGGFIFQAALRTWLGEFIAKAGDRAGLEIMIYGTGLDGGALLGWLIFPVLRRGWHTDYGVAPPPETNAPPALPWSKALLYGAGTVALSLPVLAGLSFGWTFLLRKLGLPDDPQDSIAIFTNTKSPAVIFGMLVVACVLAPMMEELLFRAGIYRFCRQHLGRGVSLLISGILFGAIHLNWAGFVPLTILGVILAMVYEATGSIRVSIAAHAFFNLTSIAAILTGLTK